MKTEFELARERRDRAARSAGGTESVRQLYQFYKAQLDAPPVASLERLRELKRDPGGGAAA